MDEIKLEDHIGLAKYIVNKFRSTMHRRLEYDDMLQEALIGLNKAINSFDGNKNVKFSTYAGVVITNQIRMYMRKQSRYKSELVSLDAPILQKNETDIATLAELFEDEKGVDPYKELLIEELFDFMNEQKWKQKRWLYEREKKYFYYMIRGYKQKEIMEIVGVSQRMAASHASSIRDNVRKHWIDDKKYKKI